MAMKNLKRNYIYNLSYQILLVISPMVTTPYISRVLGADGVGTVSYAESIVSYFALFATMGISTYGQREISYVQDSIEKRSIVFWNTKILELCTSIIAFAIYIIFAVRREDYLLYLVLSFNIIAVMADISWIFQGMEEFSKIVLRNVFFKLVSIIYTFLFVRTREDVVIYVFGISFFVFLSNVSLWWYLPKFISKVSYKELNPFKDIRCVLSLFIPTVAIEVYTVLDRTMIGIITQSSFENGYYEQALKISKVVLKIVTALGTVMIPRIGYYFEQGKNEEVKRLMYRGYRFVWFIGIPLCFGLIVTAGNFVPWFLGNGYEKVSLLICILAFLILAIGINNVTGMQYLIPTKRQNIFSLTVFIGAIVNFVMNAVLIRVFQSIGAAVASVTAETVIAVVQLFIVRKELNPRQIFIEGINYYIAGGIMTVLLWIISRNLMASALHTIIMVCIGGGVYVLVLVLLKDEFFLLNVKQILKKLRKRS